jgi:FkbM family methyltransferase
VVIRLFNGLQFRAYPDCDVSAAVLYYSLPDSKDILFLRNHVTGGTFIDIGANVGLITFLMADKIEHAILFEPNPAAANRARENLQINRLDFEVCAVALSDKMGTVALENGGAVSSCNRTVEGFTTSLPTITVPRTTLDRFLKEHVPLHSPVCAVKIDVEGHENSVLRGMLGCLKTQRPPLVMFEYLQRTDIRETLGLFEQVGYTAFELSSSGLKRVTLVTRPLQNLFACPNELAGDFGLLPSA